MGPGAWSGGGVSPLNIPAWRGFPLRDRLAAHTGLPVAVDNDAKALALGEGWVGAARGVRDYIAMVVSTGVGGGIVLDGRLLDGAGGNPRPLRPPIVQPDGRPRRGAAAGDEVRRRTGTLVGRAVASVVNLLDLRLAVVAGSVALGYGGAFFAAAQAELDARSRIEFGRGARIVPAGLGDAGPLVGAAAVGLRGEGHAIGVG